MSKEEQVTDADLMTGHPAAEAEKAAAAAGGGEAADQGGEKPAAKAEFSPIFLGGRKFTSAEDLAVYTATLERERMELERYRPTREEQEIVNGANEPKIEDLMYEDPAAYTRLLKEQAKKEILQQIQSDNSRKSIWDEFYKEYPDLANEKDLVGVYHRQLEGEVGNLPVKEGLARIAEATRRRIQGYKGAPASVEQLKSGPAVVASGNAGPAAQVTTTVPSKSFAEQLAEMRAKRRKAV